MTQPHGSDVRFASCRSGTRHDKGRAIGSGDLENCRQGGIRQGLQVARASQHLGNSVQGLEMALRPLQEVQRRQR